MSRTGWIKKACKRKRVAETTPSLAFQPVTRKYQAHALEIQFVRLFRRKANDLYT